LISAPAEAEGPAEAGPSRLSTDDSGEGTRTLDTADMSRMLYHLSYAAARVMEHIIGDRSMSTGRAAQDGSGHWRAPIRRNAKLHGLLPPLDRADDRTVHARS
jgi:hypothetical protein